MGHPKLPQGSIIASNGAAPQDDEYDAVARGDEDSVPSVDLVQSLATAVKGLELMGYEVTDVALAKKFLGALARGATPPVSTRSTVYIYNTTAGTWHDLPPSQLRGLVQALDGLLVHTVDKHGQPQTNPLRLTNGKIESVVKCALHDLDHLKLFFFDEAPTGVAVQNGFVKVDKDGIAFESKTAEHRVMYSLPFMYNAEAECPEWLRALDQIFGRDSDAEDKIKLLQEFVGAAVTGVAVDYAKCLILIGEGANGKSVVAETIAEQLFHPKTVSYSPPQRWNKRFGSASLRNSHLNFAAELPNAAILASDVFKAVVDGGSIEVEPKNKDAYSIKARAAHLFSTNSVPRSVDNSFGFWRRFLMLRFERDFTKDPGAETKEAVKARLAQERQGILRWALEGALRLIQKGAYTLPASHFDALTEAKIASDDVLAFLEARRDPNDTNTEMASIDVYRAYSKWCTENGAKPISHTAFGLRLKSHGIEKRRTNAGIVCKIGLQSDWSFDPEGP